MYDHLVFETTKISFLKLKILKDSNIFVFYARNIKNNLRQVDYIISAIR